MPEPRYIPPGQTVEVTTTTLGNHFFLTPTPYLAEIVVGILARAKEQYNVRIHAVVMLSSHYHMLLTPADGEELAGFMCYVNGLIAREALRLIDWEGKLWGGRYHPVLVSPEPHDLEERLRYILSNSVKEDLVEKMSDWEGLHCAAALMEGKSLQGIWYDRTLEYEVKRRARRRGEDEGAIDLSAFITRYELELDPLPCWRELSTQERCRRVREMVSEIEETEATRRRREGKSVLGMAAIRNQNPMNRPSKVKKSAIPRIHAANAEVRKAFKRARREFLAFYREASICLKCGLEANFPRECFPPSLPFARDGSPFDPFGGMRAGDLHSGVRSYA